MVVKRWLVLCCVTCVVHGRVATDPDYTRNEILGDTEEVRVELEKVLWMELDDGRGNDIDGSGRAGSKDMLYPILIGVAAKLLSVIPVILTSLALVAGFSLATSKAALLLGGVLAFYHYLSEGHFLTPVSKHWKHLMPDWGAALLGQHGYHPQLGGHPGLGYPGLGYHRDRNDRRWGLHPSD